MILKQKTWISVVLFGMCLTAQRPAQCDELPLLEPDTFDFFARDFGGSFQRERVERAFSLAQLRRMTVKIDLRDDTKAKKWFESREALEQQIFAEVQKRLAPIGVETESWTAVSSLPCLSIRSRFQDRETTDGDILRYRTVVSVVEPAQTERKPEVRFRITTWVRSRLVDERGVHSIAWANLQMINKIMEGVDAFVLDWLSVNKPTPEQKK